MLQGVSLQNLFSGLHFILKNLGETVTESVRSRMCGHMLNQHLHRNSHVELLKVLVLYFEEILEQESISPVNQNLRLYNKYQKQNHATPTPH